MNKLLILPLALAAAALLSSCATAPAGGQTAGLGETKAQAIEVCMPQGERRYIEQLRCADGGAPTYKRVGSMGSRNEISGERSKEQSEQMLKQIIGRGAALAPGETDYHIIDGYEVNCRDKTRTLYFDMYHCNAPQTTVPPRGFRFAGG